ncbi:MAG: hypothetical protein QOK89_03295 [Nitrososphaeraceae archaeon]|nr:hypothetical protein [Nitrososphaeraceae archaeon]
MFIDPYNIINKLIKYLICIAVSDEYLIKSLFLDLNNTLLYIVRARPKNDLSGLRKELNSDEISKLRPFGKTLQYGLDNAKIDPNDGYALWIEEDYCNPPLVMERESVLDRYFDDSTVQLIASEKEGFW